MREPVELDMYTDVFKIRKMIHHVQRIPLPFPMTALGLTAGVALEWAMFYFDGGNPIIKHVFIPLVVAGWISYYEPDGISLSQITYAYIRQLFRPKRRVVNRPVMVPKRHPELKYVGGLTRIEIEAKGGNEHEQNEHDREVLQDAVRAV